MAEQERDCRQRVEAAGFAVHSVVDAAREYPPAAALWAVLDQLVDTVAHQFPEMAAPRAADLVACTFLEGVGAH